ncbi:MAG TPA: ATP-binding protein [Gemmatimonadales bacterium]|nr:ATP-binding protein [Gemmatimonadales bacterium]
MRLATRVFLSTSLLVAATVLGLILAADRILRHELERETGASLEREARLVARLVPPDSLAWPTIAISLGRLIGHRVTLIDPTGRVRGDTEFPADALPDLENHATRPEVLQALKSGVGRSTRYSVSTDLNRMYVALHAGPPGIMIVRVSTTLATVDAQIQAVEWAVALAGVVAIGFAALLAWVGSRHFARPLVQLTAAAQAIAEERTPQFPDSRVPEIAQHARALHAMHGQLVARFSDLRAQREESATLVEAMTDGIIATDARGAILTCNAAARRLLRLDPVNPPPPLAELFHEKEARTLVDDVLLGRDVGQRELRLADRSVVVTGSPLPGGGTLLVLRDISELRHLETVRRDFVANVSHELKTPLTAITGYAETLVAEADPSSQTEKFAATILAHAHRMQRLVEDLLDLSRIESGGWRPHPVPLDVVTAARDAWAPFAERARNANVEFKVSVAAGVERLVADPDALRQILTNLYDNALRHMPRGGRVAVTVEPAPGNHGTVSVAVADNGSGIPAEHLPRIFERFYRVDTARSREQGGTGLGLAIVKHLVEAHGGKVAAESALSRGTTIRLVFPSRSPVTEP